jgi:two-component system chemotaxis sensor kinase CheA
VVAHLNEIPPLDELNPEFCYTYWDIILTTSRGDNAIRDVFIFVEEESELRIDVIDESSLPFDQIEQKKLGHILVERGDLTAEDMVRCWRAGNSSANSW